MNKVKKKVRTLLAALMCVCMASSPLATFAETVDGRESDSTSILSDNFDELLEKTAQLQQPDVLPEEGIRIQTYGAERNADFTIDLSVGKIINYNGYQTHEYSLSDGTVVYCIEPSKKNPSNGSYSASVSSDALLSAVAYYGYGGPGYETDKGMYYMLQPNVRPYAYVLTHMALSYVYDGCSDDTDAFLGNADSAEGVKQMVSLMGSYTWTVPSDFAAFTVGTGGQTMGFGYYYNPTGYVNLVKTSANPSITDGNSCYSLKDAVYGVYSDEGCTNQVGMLTTDEAGNSNALELRIGSYWVKELTAPKGFALDTTAYPINVSNDATATVSATDYPQSDPIWITLGKVDADTNANKPQGSASLAGAEFTVRYYSGLYDTDPAGQGQSAVRAWVLRTDEDGLIYMDNSYKVGGDDFYYKTNGSTTFPIGTITIQETKAPTGYLVNDEVFVRQVTADGSMEDVNTYNQPIILEQSIRGGVKVQKRDYETGTTLQGGASLAGAEIAIVNQNDNAVSVNGVSYAKGETVLTLITDEKGAAATTADALPYGDYKLVEKKAPAGYQLSGVLEHPFTIRDNGVIVDMTADNTSIKDKIIRGGVKLQKCDYETGDNHPLGGADFEGAEISIVNQNSNPVIVNGVSFAEGKTVLTLKTDKNGYAETAADVLPYGDYKAVETKAPAGYQLSGITEQNFSITKNGELVDLTGVDTAIKDKVKRGDFELRKIDSITQDSMPGVQFKITNMNTAESHTFTTDENGYYSSENSWNAHSSNTNGGGAEDGLWFANTTGGQSAAVNDSFGALPYGIYFIEEMEGVGNVGKEMFSGMLVIRRNSTTIDLGNIENYGEEPEITITTQALDAASGTQIAVPAEEMKIVDTVYYEGMVPGREYTIKGVLMDQSTKKPFLIDDKEVRSEYTFTAERTGGMVEIPFTFNASALAGKSVVVFETCTYRLREVAAHEEIKDAKQTVYFPAISTTLKDTVTDSHTAGADKKMQFTDTVDYEGLMPGRIYFMKGILMDKTTGEPLLVGGKKVTSEKSFTAEGNAGSVELTFTVDGSSLGGKSVVAFERCTYEEREVAVHADIDAESQTVHIPSIDTNLTDAATGEKTVTAGKSMTLVDAVDYYNLIPGNEYTMKGILMDKETGDVLLIDGEEVAAEQTFIPEEPDGSVELTFTFDGSSLGGKSVVAFERCSYKEQEIAVHTDIEDEDQTVSVRIPQEQPLPQIEQPKTGDDTPFYTFIGILTVAGTALGILLYRKRRKHTKIDK